LASICRTSIWTMATAGLWHLSFIRDLVEYCSCADALARPNAQGPGSWRSTTIGQHQLVAYGVLERARSDRIGDGYAGILRGD
jgi:hypothetical protein